jgi:putative ABC transport system permease protein
MSASRRLLHWLVGSEWRAHPVRALVAIAAIALGVALGFAIHLINAAAFNEFSAAVKSLSGQSDLQVRGTQSTFDEAIYPALARRPGVAEASPVLEVEAVLADRKGTLKILGIDVFRAAAVTPDLTGAPQPEHAMDALGDDTIFLSPSAMEWLQVNTGDRLRLRSGTQTVALRVAGSIAHARSGQRIAVMDIGALQWRFDRLGRLSHVDLKLATGIDRTAFRNALARELQGRLVVTETEDQEARSANMSRAYRVNLNVLALVALFTGAFLVFSTQAMSVIRRRSQFALLRVVGVTRRQLMLQVLVEGGLLGVLGSLLGLGGGYALAAAVLQVFGGDLGGGYFPGVTPSARFQPLAACVLFLAGTLVALLGSAAPAWEAVQARPAQALKAGAEDVALAKLAPPWPALACLALGALCAWLPPVSGLPLFGYLAVALLLVGGIALMPRCAAWSFGALSRRIHPKRTVVALALARLANAPNQASIALGGVLSSFSLMVAMAIMVASFRVSVDDWLGRILPAAVYLRSTAGGDTGALRPAEQQAIAAVDGIARIDFLRTAPLVLDPARPGVVLIARTIDPANPGAILPLIGDALPVARMPADTIPVWVSEAMTDLYGFRIGMRVKLPFQGGMRDAIVAGIWRDYARQSGAIQMRLEDYRASTGDNDVTDAGIWLQPGTTPAQVVERIRRLPFGNLLEFAGPGDIRAISLKIFDRSFAVTYLLEIVAMVIGLFGVATTFSAQTLARAREFGMLRHVGVMRRQILGILALEGGLLTVAGIAVGFVLGLAISLILVFVVNPQSFHWTMRLHLPWGLLGAVAAALLVASAATALAAGRHAVSGDAVRAVREDW